MDLRPRQWQREIGCEGNGVHYVLNGVGTMDVVSTISLQSTMGPRWVWGPLWVWLHKKSSKKYWSHGSIGKVHNNNHKKNKKGEKNVFL